jgi:hypothetical protein
VLVTHFERSAEVLGNSNASRLSIVWLDLNREQKEIILGDIVKCEKGNKKPMNRKTKQLNNTRKKEGKKKERKILNQELRVPCKM